MSISLIVLAFVAVLYLLFPVRRKTTIKNDNQAQIIALYRQELTELEKVFEQGEINETEYQKLKSELDKKSSLAMLQTKKTTFAYRPTLVIPAVVFLTFIAASVLYYAKFYSGEVSRWDGFKATEKGAIIEGLFNPKLVTPYIEKENYQICFAMQQETLANYPNNPEVLGNLANCYLQSGYVQLAEMAATRGLDHHPDNPDLNYYYAQSRLMLTGEGNKDMIDALTKTIKANPEHQGALWLMGLISYQQANFEAADFFFTRLQEIGGTTPELAQLLADVRERNEEAAQAQQSANQTEASTETTQAEAATNETAESDSGESEVAQSETVESETGSQPIRFNVTIKLDELLAERVNSNAAVFVVVRSTEGGLLLAGKYALSAFPMSVKLAEDGGEVMKAGDLDDYNAFVVSARIAQDGTAMPKDGDLQSVPLIANRAQNIDAELVINQVVGE